MDEQDFTSTMTKGDAQKLRRSRNGMAASVMPRITMHGNRLGTGGVDEDDVETPDQTEVFQQVIAIIRWGVLGLLIILATPPIVDNGDDVLSTLLLGFLALTVTRHARPIRFDQRISCGRITGEAGRQRSLAMNRMERLTDANSLLYSLHRVAQTLPASLDLSDVLDTTMGRLRSLFDYDTMALLVFDDTDASWQVMRSEGTSLPLRLGPTMLPNPLKTAIAQNRLIDMANLPAARTIGLNENSGSGLYTTLTARGQIIGLLAIESTTPGNYDERTVQMLNGFVGPVALAVDNARWFGRLRTMGADEERTRIARDLHDRIGQSMAFLAFELDRVIKHHGEGKDISVPLDQLQTDVRHVIREIRDTLSDLRTDVSDDKGLQDTIADFAERLTDRSGVAFALLFDSRSDRRTNVRKLGSKTAAKGTNRTDRYRRDQCKEQCILHHCGPAVAAAS